MFCKECGNELKDGAMFCGKCGTKVVSENAEDVVNAAATEEATSAEETPAEETPVEETPIEEAPVEEAPVEEAPAGNAPQEPIVKKKKKLPKALIAVAAVVVILGGGFLLFKDAIMNKLMDFMPAETQLQSAYKNMAQNLGETTGEIVTEVTEVADTSEGTVTGILSISLGDSVKSMLQSASSVDLGDISTVYASYQVAYSDSQFQYDLAVGLEETSLLSANMVMDMEEGLISISVPELSDTAIEMSFDADMGIDMEEFNMQMQQSEYYMSMLEDVLPDAELIEEMVPRYVEAVIKAIDDVEREKTTLEVEGVSQKATSLTININAELIKNIGVAIAEELADDDSLKDYLKSILSTTGVAGEESLADEVFEQGYESIVTGVETAFAELAEEFTAEIKIVTWVDSDNEIIGIEVADFMEFVQAEDGKDVAAKLVVTEPGAEEIMKVTVIGQESGDEFAGDITIYVESEEVLTIKVDKYISTDDKFELDASITVTAEMFEEITGMDNPLGDITLRAEISSTEEKGNITLSAIVAGSEWVSVSFMGTSDDEADITYPEDVMSIEEIEDWVGTIDCADLIDSLDDLGVLDILGVDKDMLNESLDEAIDYYLDELLNGDSYYDDYEDDYYDDYYDYYY